jgi:L-asparaginase
LKKIEDKIPVTNQRLTIFETQKTCMAIRIFITGGTFDKEYNELNGELFFKNTHMPELLEKGRSKVNVAIRTLMMIDSLEMTDQDRALIAHHCNQSEEDKIIITHGTDTMAETAAVLAQEVKNKTVVLTGAMIPIKFGSSDGLFNLGSALAFVQTLPAGVYVAMNGRYFNWDNVRKNKETGVFEEAK